MDTLQNQHFADFVGHFFYLNAQQGHVQNCACRIESKTGVRFFLTYTVI